MRAGSRPCGPGARWAYEALRPYAGLFVVEGICAVLRGPVAWYLALLAGSLGDDAAAGAYRAAALDAARAAGVTALAGRIERQAVPPPAPATGVFRRDGEVWVLAWAGREVRLKDSKGLRDLAVLLARPGAGVAALDLVSARSAADCHHLVAAAATRRSGQEDLRPPSGLGDVIDGQARAAYQQRLRDLEEEAAEADAAADTGRSERIAAERDALLAALTEAYGLGAAGPAAHGAGD